MTFKIIDVPFEVKAVKQGKVSGYASVFGNVDLQNEIMAPGCFDKCLSEMKASGRKIPLLWQHKRDVPVGTFSVLQPDAKGLWAEADLLVDHVVAAKEAAALADAGAVTGFSIGHMVKQSSFDRATGVRTITESSVAEISLVTFPANPDARVEAVKMKLAHGSLPSLPEFERLLRDAGFSRTQAATVAAHGLKHLLSDSGEEANATTASDLVKALSGLSLPKI